jgi:hypothetical protein
MDDLRALLELTAAIAADFYETLAEPTSSAVDRLTSTWDRNAGQSAFRELPPA